MKQTRRLTMKEIAIVIYFNLSMVMLTASDDTPLLIILLIVLNFVFAGLLLVTQVKPRKENQDESI